MTTVLIIALLFGILLFLGGGFYVYAQGMSDSPGASDPRGGCIAMVAGVVVFVIAAIALIVMIVRALQ